ncbi:MAG: hypothetical protein VB095_03035 [Anaerovorax sp.]|nr:hypothetical protein [Anaerovorax sp.]
MGMINDGFIIFVVAVVLIILASIQFTLNKILRVLEEIKAQKRQ